MQVRVKGTPVSDLTPVYMYMYITCISGENIYTMIQSYYSAVVKYEYKTLSQNCTEAFAFVNPEACTEPKYVINGKEYTLSLGKLIDTLIYSLLQL